MRSIDGLVPKEQRPNRNRPPSTTRSLRFEQLEDRNLLSIAAPDFPAIDDAMRGAGHAMAVTLSAQNGCVTETDGYRLDGTDDLLGTGVNTGSLPDRVSLAQWVKLDSLGTYQTLWAGYDPGVSNRWVMQVQTDGRINFGTRYGGDVTSSVALSPGTWHLVIGTFDRTLCTLVLSIDGAEVGRVTLSDDLRSGTELLAGATVTEGRIVHTTKGLIAKPTVYDEVLTSEDWGAIYAAGEGTGGGGDAPDEPEAGEETDPIADFRTHAWEADPATGTLRDTVGNVTGTLRGGAAIAQDGTVAFDGSDDAVELSEVLAFPAGTPFTISFTYQGTEARANGPWGRVLLGRDNSDIYANVVLTAEGKVSYVFYDGAWNGSIVSQTAVNDGLRHKVVVARDASDRVSIAVDGRVEATKMPAVIRCPEYPYRISHLMRGYSVAYTGGSLGGIGIYSTEATPEQMAALTGAIPEEEQDGDDGGAEGGGDGGGDMPAEGTVSRETLDRIASREVALTLSPTGNAVAAAGVSEGRNAYRLDGDGDYLTTGLSAANLPTTVTISSWVSLDNLGGYQTIASGYDAAVSNRWALQVSPSGSLSFGTRYGGEIATGAGAIAAGGWHLVTATFDEASHQAALFVDQGKVGETQISDNLRSNAPLLFGAMRAESGAMVHGLKGSIDPRVYDAVLSEGEIAALVDAGLHPDWISEELSPALQSIQERSVALAGSAQVIEGDIATLAAGMEEAGTAEGAIEAGAQLAEIDARIAAWEGERRALIGDVLALVTDLRTVAVEAGTEALAVSDALGTTLTAGIPEIGGTMGMRTWRGRAAEAGLTRACTESGGEALVGRGAMLTLDLADAGRLVQGVSFEITSTVPGEAFTVQAYRGSELLSESVPGEDGAVSFDDAEGITGVVVLRSSLDGEVRVSGLSVKGEMLEPQSREDGIGLEHQNVVAARAAPQWTAQPYDPFQIRANLQQQNPAALMLFLGDPSKYRAFTLQNLNSDGVIRRDWVMYFDGSQLRPLPQEWYAFDGQRRIVLLPGSPEHVYVMLETAIPATNFTVADSERMEEVMVPEGLRPRIAETKLTNQSTEHPGFRTAITGAEFASAQQAVNAAGRLLLNIENHGAGSGNITVEVYDGNGKTWSGTSSFACEERKGVEVNIAAGVTSPVRIVMTWGNGETTEEYIGVPSGGSADPGSGRTYTAGEQRRIARAPIQAQAAAVARGDAVSSALASAASAARNYLAGTGTFDAVASATGHAGDGTVEIASTQPEGVESQYALAMQEWIERHPRLADQVMERLGDEVHAALVALMSGEADSEIAGAREGVEKEVAERGLLAPIKRQRLLAFAGLSDWVVENAQLVSYAETRTGTSGTVDLFTVQGTDAVIFGWQETPSTYHSVEVEEHLTFGSDLTRALAARGMGEGAFDFTDDFVDEEQEGQWKDLTGLYDPQVNVPGLEAVAVNQESLASNLYMGMLQGLWKTKDGELWHGLSHEDIISRAVAVTGLNADHLRSLDTNSTEAFARHLERVFGAAGLEVEDGETPTIQFNDYVRPDGTIRAHFNPPHVPGAWRTDVYVTFAGTVQEHYTVPPSQLFADIPVGPQSTTLQLRVVMSGLGGGTAEMRSSTIDIRERREMLDLSTNNDPEARQRETPILNRLKRNFPVDVTMSWQNLLGSAAHHGEYASHAIDLNAPGDRGAVIRAMDKGKIERLYFDGGGNSILVLRHTLEDGTTYDSVYMHMPMTQLSDGSYQMLDGTGGVVATLREGDMVEEHQSIASVGDVGQSDGDHLHAEVHAGDWRASRAINLDGVLRELDRPIPTKVDVSGTTNYVVTFDIGLQRWVSENERIVVHTDGDVYALAWEDGKGPEEMDRVVWDTQSEKWLSPEKPGFFWGKKHDGTFDWIPL